ncbi:MAG: hypothetical protein MJ131_08030 [Lachnospiraceae bacterium]|nr:hypothetical protein [Lachnospiraceae bacterium]
MENKKKLDFHTDNLAVPEITVDEEDASVSDSDEDNENDVVYDNLAFPEIHIKSAHTRKLEDK